MSSRPHIAPSPSWPDRFWTAFTSFVRVFFVVVLLAWILSLGNLRDVATDQPDTMHTFPVDQHGSTFYIHPVLGKICVTVPWLLAGSLLLALLMDYAHKKQPRKRS